MISRYKFAKETQPDLLAFIKLAQEKKDEGDFEQYEKWSQLLPPDQQLIKEANECKTTIIDLCSNEEAEAVASSSAVIHSELLENVEETKQANQGSVINDIASVIRENLQTQNALSDLAKETLLNCDENQLKLLFDFLENELNTEEIYFLGEAVQDANSQLVLQCFCRHLLLVKAQTEFCEKLLNLFNKLIATNHSTFEEQCISQLLHATATDVLLKYLKKTNIQFQTTLIRNFIFSIRKLDINQLGIIESLLNNQVECEVLNKLVDMLPSVAQDHSDDKNFGKLLVDVIDYLGPNLTNLEKPLKHLISEHKSVWKSKLAKTFSSSYEDSFMFTQSFRQ